MQQIQKRKWTFFNGPQQHLVSCVGYVTCTIIVYVLYSIITYFHTTHLPISSPTHPHTSPLHILLSPCILLSSSHSVSSFSEPLARHYFTQALLAVVYLHERGVFHRDIKPENCVLDGHFNLKLTDFGTNKVAISLHLL